jgi:hypothetical protein
VLGRGRQNPAAFDCGKGARQTLLDTLPNLDDHRFEEGYRTMDVGSWLRSLGLGQYEANFRDNKIDADVLPQLTADDLKDIGVSALGDRLRLLAAIAALSGRIPSVSAPASPPKLAPAERRPITVMFCDRHGRGVWRRAERRGARPSRR